MIPSAPTDNLYKFITFLGIVIFVFSVWTINDNLVQVERVVTQFETTAKIVEKRINSSESVLENNLKRQAEIRKQLADRDKLPIGPDLAAELNAQSEGILKELMTLLLRAEDIRKMNESILPLTDEARMLLRVHARISLFLYAGAVIGVLMALFGTLSWYFLHQRHQDALLRAQLRAADRDSAATHDGLNMG